MERDRRQVALEQAHVLDDQGIGAGIPYAMGEGGRLVEFGIGEEGVEGDIDPGEITVGVPRQALDGGEVIAGGGPGAKARRPDIDGVGAVIDGGDAAAEIPGRGEQFHRVGWDEELFRIHSGSFSAQGFPARFTGRGRH